MGTGKLLGNPNKLWGSDLRWTRILSRGSRNTPSRFMLHKPGQAPAAMSHSAPRLHFSSLNNVSVSLFTVYCQLFTVSS